MITIDKDKTVIIIGAGICGLIAALELEKKGFLPIILEKEETIGGKLQTKFWNEIPLDEGFQVLLTAYPTVQKYILTTKIALQNIEPASIIYLQNKKYIIGDPLRNIKFLLPTIAANIGSIKDKLLIWKLQIFVKSKSIEEIFAIENETTRQYLQAFGFSQKVITCFFKPFYTGIFLESNLETSCRQFLFVFKMFAEGHAAFVTNGIQQVAQVLKNQLVKTEIFCNHTVESVTQKQVICSNGKSFAASNVIVTTPLPKMQEQVNWHTCNNLYFTCKQNISKQNCIALFANENSIVNNIYFLPNQTQPIVSVTVVKQHSCNNKELQLKVKLELLAIAGIETLDCIYQTEIKKALPKLAEHRLPTKENCKVENGIIYTGDYLYSGSLHAAMLAGEVAAACIH